MVHLRPTMGGTPAPHPQGKKQGQTCFPHVPWAGDRLQGPTSEAPSPGTWAAARVHVSRGALASTRPLGMLHTPERGRPQTCHPGPALLQLRRGLCNHGVASTRNAP